MTKPKACDAACIHKQVDGWAEKYICKHPKFKSIGGKYISDGIWDPAGTFPEFCPLKVS